MWSQTGCYSEVEEWFEERLHLVGVCGIAIALLQVIFFIVLLIQFYCILYILSYIRYAVVRTDFIDGVVLCRSRTSRIQNLQSAKIVSSLIDDQ